MQFSVIINNSNNIEKPPAHIVQGGFLMVIDIKEIFKKIVMEMLNLLKKVRIE